MLRKILKIVGTILLLCVILFAGLLLFSTVTDYSPEAGSEETLKPETSANTPLSYDTLDMLIWNIGYAGLGSEMDFFNDGGKSVMPTEAQNENYLSGITTFLAGVKDSVEFMLIQEIDRNSKRSYHIDQVKEISALLPGFSTSFALNYDVKFVPVPFALPYKPYGKTYGGLGSYSRYQPAAVTRVQYPGGFAWPTKLYMLDRCALEQRFKLPDGKDLVVVNTHNTAYDATGEIKKVEMAFMKKRYEAEHSKGNYVIVGGDWNQVPPGFDSKHFSSNISEDYTPQALTKDIFPGRFTVSFDSSTATNRSNKTAFVKGETYTTLIDYFVSSPNIEVISVRGIDLGFKYSDHQPVLLKFRLIR
jgi:endonuclease/exonuclease/phosphatase family metal-dependent hydrolase